MPNIAKAAIKAGLMGGIAPRGAPAQWRGSPRAATERPPSAWAGNAYIRSMVLVASRAIRRIEYDALSEELFVTFVGGKTYVYEGVPDDVHARLLAADSKGRFFNEAIKDRYRFRGPIADVTVPGIRLGNRAAPG
jgi:hypothetical protein